MLGFFQQPSMSRNLFSSSLLTSLLLAAWFAYSPGFTGALHFDDRPNLGSLGQITSAAEALAFVFDGNAGPLGRPLALASFALQRQQWPDGLVVLLQTNVALHLGTALMVFMLGLGLARALRIEKAHWVAFLGCSLWLLSPFLASAPLMLVQRMTLLAGLFVFAGLSAYVWGRLLYRDRPRIALALMGSGIILGTILAGFSKENGLLLPLLALIIEFTLLRHTSIATPRGVKLLRFILLAFPSGLIAAYLLQRIPELFALTSYREFLPMERAASQPPILWEYVRNLLIPSTSSVTPFTDDRLAADGWTQYGVVSAVIAWIAAISTAFLLRRKAPIILFAIAFFIAGHALESSVINLELYYAHRNYIPAFGLYFGMAAALVLISQQWPRIVVPGIVSYVLAFGLVLVSTTSLWGQPLVAAEIWARQHPDSHRAQQFLANEYYKLGDAYTAKRILEDASSTDSSGSLPLQRLFTCAFKEPLEEQVAREVEQAVVEIREGPRNQAIGNVVLELTSKVTQGACDVISAADLRVLIDATMENEAYKDATGTKSQLWNARALIAQSEGNTELAIDFVQEMYKVSRHANHARLYSGLLVGQGRTEEALRFLRAARNDGPKHPIRKWIRVHMIDDQIKLIQQDIASSRQRPSQQSLQGSGASTSFNTDTGENNSGTAALSAPPSPSGD